MSVELKEAGAFFRTLHLGLGGKKPRKPRALKHLPRRGALLKIVRLLLDGKTNRAVARDAPAGGGTVKRVRAFIEGFVGEPIKCPCGQNATHQGWCCERYKRSEARQKFIQGWKPERTK